MHKENYIGLVLIDIASNFINSKIFSMYNSKLSCISNTNFTLTEYQKRDSCRLLTSSQCICVGCFNAFDMCCLSCMIKYERFCGYYVTYFSVKFLMIWRNFHHRKVYVELNNTNCMMNICMYDLNESAVVQIHPCSVVKNNYLT